MPTSFQAFHREHLIVDIGGSGMHRVQSTIMKMRVYKKSRLKPYMTTGVSDKLHI